MTTAKIDISELFEAYYDCRKNKRHTANALAFEMDYESKLINLCEEINNGVYTPGRSIAFIVEKPVKREIFAADFRDRVVHHLVVNKLNPHFEKQFIYDSYGCRTDRGSHMGIKRVTRFIRKCSRNYQSPCYILKLDIEGFFMHINKDILFSRLLSFINKNYAAHDKDLIIELCEKIIFNNPTENCKIKGKKTDWNGLPLSKSLFHSAINCGLPIGNLTSQIFANFYLDSFDHYVKHDLQISYYGRYVDDFVVVHNDKAYLKSLIPQMANFLNSMLGLNLHPRKIYLQSYEKGVSFLGSVIKPHRVYIASRTKGGFYDTIASWNKMIRNKKKLKPAEWDSFLSSINSYLGILKHYKTYKLRKKMLRQNLSACFYNYVYISGGYSKLVSKIKPTTKCQSFRAKRKNRKVKLLMDC